MKKTLQLLCVFCVLIFTYSCGSGTPVETDPGSTLAQTWQVRTMSAYDSMDCSNATSLFTYNSSGETIEAITAADCNNLEWFFDISDDDNADFTANTFCGSQDGLDISMYMHFDSTDSLSQEAAGTYIKTMYAKQPNGLDHSIDYSTYGRYYTYGANMTTQILAQIEDDTGFGNDRVVEADEDADDRLNWTYEATPSTLTMKWMDDSAIAAFCDCTGATNLALCNATGVDADSCAGAEGIWTTGATDGVASCAMITFQLATDYKLRGCTDPLASNYFGGDNNDFGITATEETGNCHYSIDEASQPCVKIKHDDLNLDGQYAEDELVTYSGIIDCAGACQYEAEIVGWIGDGICDGGNRGDGAFNCEAFEWDGWDCACAKDCFSTYEVDDFGNVTILDVDGGTPQVGEGNNIATAYSSGNCQEACNVEDCGYDIGDIDDTSTWDCCPEDCINNASTATSCLASCDIGACNYYRNIATDGGTCDDGVSTTKAACDTAGANWTTNNIGLCCAPGNDANGDPIDCAAVAGDGSCDEECNTGACNKDGGDCE